MEMSGLDILQFISDGYTGQERVRVEVNEREREFFTLLHLTPELLTLIMNHPAAPDPPAS